MEECNLIHFTVFQCGEIKLFQLILDPGNSSLTKKKKINEFNFSGVEQTAFAEEAFESNCAPQQPARTKYSLIE